MRLPPNSQSLIAKLSHESALPYQEVENFLLHYFKISRSALYQLSAVGRQSSENWEHILSLLKKRRQGIPTPYLTRTAYFLDLELYVDERVFLPRPETEGLVELVARMSPRKARGRIVDIGTGSGNIAISLARLFPSSSVFATDVEEGALEVARINIRRYGLEKRVRLLLSDLFSASELKGEYDLIVANPPYIPSGEIPLLQKEVRFEPRVAIDGGEDGFFYIRGIIEEGLSFLKEGGAIFLEIDPRHKKKIERLKLPASFYPDLAGNIRYAVIFKSQYGDRNHRQY